MTDPFLGELRLLPFNFAPQGWAFANGQLLSIAQNTALFSLLGTTYGGNGTSTFALPDLRGRVPISSGQGPGLSLYDLGEEAGVENVTLNSGQMPVHTHQLEATLTATTKNPSNALPSVTASGAAYGAAPKTADMSPAAIGSAGSNQPHENRQPYLVLNWCIALQGIFPSRS
jgi:microcystin-dependent protein